MDGLNNIVHDLERSLGPLDGEPAALAGGITNRNYRASLGGTDYVVRLPGRNTELLGIDRAAERAACEAAAALGIAPAVAAWNERCLVTQFIACRPFDRGEVAAVAAQLARALRAFHECGLQLSRSFWVADLLGEYAALVLDGGGKLPAQYARARLIAARIDAVLGRAGARPCHNDLLAANLILAEADGRTMIVDWEYAGMGDPRFDLGNLSVNNGFDAAADEQLLRAYHDDAPTDRMRAAHALMRVLSDAREAAWGVVQGTLSELDFDFDAYADEHFERLDALAGNPDFEEWLAAARG